MKYLIRVIQYTVGLLFIFSGLVKANDPVGLSYKMHEFFEAWGLAGLNPAAFTFSVLMISFEVVAGVALLLANPKKITLLLLMSLTVFFTFLTAYAKYATNDDGSPKFKACGCFGDCIPLTPTQSFGKDLVLLLLISALILGSKKLWQPLSNKVSYVVIIVSAILSLYAQYYTYTNLPMRDCLSFKVGNNILQKKQYIPDSTLIQYTYTKGGKAYIVTPPNYPEWLLNEDSTYIQDTAKTITKTIAEGNKGDIILDFALVNKAGIDTTEAILSNPKTIYLLLITNIESSKNYDWEKAFTKIRSNTQATLADSLSNKPPLYIVTNKVNEATAFFVNNYKVNAAQILFCDEKPLLAAGRTRPTLFKITNGVIVQKTSYANWGKLF